MMRSLFPVTLCCISLLSLQQQLLALPAGARVDRHRLTFLKSVPDGGTFMAETALGRDASFGPHYDWWKRLRLLRAVPPMKRAVETPAGKNEPPPWAEQGVERRAARARRHTHIRGRGHHHHHPKLMRVGCVLGTCQVQNLSHRLYQLIGQSGREDTSPMNPKSPHSYG